MSLLERFTGRLGPDDRADDLVATDGDGPATSLQVLFPGALDLDADALTLAIRSYHPSLAAARAELMAMPDRRDEAGGAAEALIGLAGWGGHVVKLVGFRSPIPREVFDACVRPAHFGQQIKQDAAAHESHVLLYYAGKDPDPLERYVALAVVAAALARFDALLVLNEAARSAFPATALPGEGDDSDRLELLRALPIPLLYGGFVKVEVGGEGGVWMRTFGNGLLGLPDLALKAEGHHQGGETFDLFANLLEYLRESGAKFAAGHTVQVGEGTYLRLRAANAAEWFLESESELFVVERIGADDINRG